MSEISAVGGPMCLPTDYPACMPDDTSDPVADGPTVEATLPAQAPQDPGLAFVMPPPAGAGSAAAKAVETMLKGGPAVVAGASSPFWITLGVAAGLALGFPSKAGDGPPPAQADGPVPPSHPVGDAAPGEIEADTPAEPEPAPAAAAPPSRDGGVPPAPSRATEFVTPAADPEVDALVARIKDARTAADPATRQALREGLRQQEAADLHKRIETLREQIVQATNPEQHVLIDELVRSYNRLIELGVPYHDPVE